MTPEELQSKFDWPALKAEWESLSDPTILGKYLIDPLFEARKSFDQCQRLGLMESQPVRVLDIGCGLGMFVEACRTLGHTAQGVDSDSPEARTLDRYCGATRIYHTVRTDNMLPELGYYDVVTLVSVNLFWGQPLEEKRPNWGRFLNKLASSTGCRLIFISANRLENTRECIEGNVPGGFREKWDDDSIVTLTR